MWLKVIVFLLLVACTFTCGISWAYFTFDPELFMDSFITCTCSSVVSLMLMLFWIGVMHDE